MLPSQHQADADRQVAGSRGCAGLRGPFWCGLASEAGLRRACSEQQFPGWRTSACALRQACVLGMCPQKAKTEEVQAMAL